MTYKKRISRTVAGLTLAGALVIGLAGTAGAEDRKQREPTKKPPPAQTFTCKKGGKRVQATSAAAAAVACRGYGGLK